MKLSNLVCSRALETVDQMIEHVRAGNFQAMKYLFEMVGLFPAPARETAMPEKSLARQLSNYLGVEERAANIEAPSTRENRS